MFKKLLIKLSFPIFVIVWGLLIQLDPDPSLYGYPFPRWCGIAFVFLGFFCVFYVFLNRKKVLAKIDEAEFRICPSCHETGYTNAFPDMRCPKCKVEVEYLEGFYDRHPDLEISEKLLIEKIRDEKPSKFDEFYKSKKAIPVALLLYVIGAFLFYYFAMRKQ